jgi:hypothetical protein
MRPAVRHSPVIPAQAGIQAVHVVSSTDLFERTDWIPACAGMAAGWRMRTQSTPLDRNPVRANYPGQR